MASKINHGFYSLQAIEMGLGSFFYRTEDEGEVEVTVVMPTADPTKLGWKDARYVGPVLEWIRDGVPRDPVFKSRGDR